MWTRRVSCRQTHSARPGTHFGQVSPEQNLQESMCPWMYMVSICVHGCIWCYKDKGGEAGSTAEDASRSSAHPETRSNGMYMVSLRQKERCPRKRKDGVHGRPVAKEGAASHGACESTQPCVEDMMVQLFSRRCRLCGVLQTARLHHPHVTATVSGGAHGGGGRQCVRWCLP